MPTYAGTRGKQPARRYPDILHQQFQPQEKEAQRRVARIRQYLHLTQQAVSGFNPETTAILAVDLPRCPVEVDPDESEPLALLVLGFRVADSSIDQRQLCTGTVGEGICRIEAALSLT